jgi:hypothetical protein
MAPSKQTQPSSLSVPVEKVARLIQTFDRQQKALLIQPVPELRTIRPEEANISAEQAELMAYFQNKMKDLSEEQRPMQDDDLFVSDLTVAEFFTLPETEQARLWHEAHQAAEHELDSDEHPVRPDALPAR